MKPYERITRFAVIAGIWLFGGISSGVDGGENMIPNGGFEESTSDAFPGWERLSQEHGIGIDRAVQHS